MENIINGLPDPWRGDRTKDGTGHHPQVDEWRQGNFPGGLLLHAAGQLDIGGYTGERLLGTLASSAPVAGKGLTASDISGIGSNTSLISALLPTTPPASTANAHLCYILFDDQFRYVTGDVDIVNTGGGYKNHTKFITTPVSITNPEFSSSNCFRFSGEGQLMFTTSSASWDAVRSLALGAEAFLTKPLHQEEMEKVAHHFSLFCDGAPLKK